MRVVILAGGRGTRLAEETTRRPKPMIEIGGRPLLWHIMSIYAAHGHRDFVVATGYMGDVIAEYFEDPSPEHGGGASVAAAAGWSVRCVATGLETQTGGRIRKLAPLLGDETFMVTYGDGVGDIDIGALVSFHASHGRLATVTAVRPPSRFGALEVDGDDVLDFSEKPQAREGWINGGFFVFEPGVIDYIEADETPLEHEPLERLARDRQLKAFRHNGFWQPVDTLREKDILESLWQRGQAPWKIR